MRVGEREREGGEGGGRRGGGRGIECKASMTRPKDIEGLNLS